MKGSIHSDQKCPLCGSRFKSQEPKGLFCPQHPSQRPEKYLVRFGKITRRFTDYPAAYQFLTGLRFQDGSGQMDERDYQIKSRPLSFNTLAQEWLAKKSQEVRTGTMSDLRVAIRAASTVWADANIKSIQFAHVEDFLSGLSLSPKTKCNILATLKQFWKWAADRYDIQPMKSWPILSQPAMKFRKTVAIDTQEMILAEIKKITAKTRPRVWLAIKWLLTYISIRPTEMRLLTEGQIDRTRGLLIVTYTKEHKPKIVPLLDDDIEIVRGLPEGYSGLPFFRHEANAGMDANKPLGKNRLYKDWKKACSNLGIEGVDLYGGTKHSTAMGIRQVATYEETRKMTGHTTNKAFDRYLNLEASAMKELYSRRQSLITPDNDPITGFDLFKEHKTEYLQ